MTVTVLASDASAEEAKAYRDRAMITAEEKCDLIAFLESLTDEGFLENPRLSNPWTTDSRP